VYKASDAVKDVAAKMGLNTDGVVTTFKSILPLWWQTGTWAELLDYLGILERFNWAVWEQGTGGPKLMFRDWLAGPIWLTNCYGTSAVAIADLQASDDVYNRVDVAYKTNSNPRIRHAVAELTPNPFAGLSGSLALRQRTFHYELNDPQSGVTGDEGFPQAVADAIALGLNAETISGTIRLSFAWNGTVNKTAYNVRAGDRIWVSDFPGGAKLLRIVETDADETGVTLTVGRQSMKLERLLALKQKDKMRKGAIPSQP